jgi:hypothetical protein
MSFMELELISKGSLYSCECGTCGRTMLTHEWAHSDFNEVRDGMMSGKLRCWDCGHAVDRSTFSYCGKQYAGRYSAPGYMDCTDWEFDTNKRRLERSLRAMYA